MTQFTRSLKLHPISHLLNFATFSSWIICVLWKGEGYFIRKQKENDVPGDLKVLLKDTFLEQVVT